MTDRPQFVDQLHAQWTDDKFICVGLDPDYSKLPPHLTEKAKRTGFSILNIHEDILYDFLQNIVDATADLVCAYKPNSAFYEDSPQAMAVLQAITHHIHSRYPNIPVVGDLKRGDIRNTNNGYAKMAFGTNNFDAITVQPYPGRDTYPPFLEWPGGKGIFPLCKTTNPGSADIQDLPINLERAVKIGKISEEEYEDIKDRLKDLNDEEGKPLLLLEDFLVHHLVAYRHGQMAGNNPNIGLVVGATHPEAFAPVRRLAGNVPFLIPGIGTQGGDLEKTLKHAPDDNGEGVLISSSSAIIFASNGEDFADAARTATLRLSSQIQQLRTT